MSVTWFGDRAVLVVLDEGADPASSAWALARAFPACSVRPGLDAVLVEARDPDATLLASVERAVARLALGAGSDEGPARIVTLDVSYDGDDLAEVATALACSVEALVAAHQRQEWSVTMMGFAPGFAYLVPHDGRLLAWDEIPRLDSPRARVPAGSVAVAAGMSAVYPATMPGGWRLLGRTDRRLFDPDADADPTLLHPGDRVRFAATAS